VRVHADGVRLSKVLPAGPVDVFAGQDLVVLARYEGSGPAQVRFDGTTSDGPVSWTSEVDFPERERGNAFVPRLWATQRVGWLSAEKRQHGGSPEIDDEIRELGERYGIPTEFTSYLVQEPQTVAANRMRRGPVGGVAGSFGGIADAVISRATEVVQGFPIVLLAIAIVAISGPSLTHAMLAVGIGAIPDFARVSRSVALQLRAREFVEAARGLGASELRILRSEILPNMVGALLVIATFDGAQAVMWEAALSFLGLGVQPPEPSFGGMLSDAKSYLALQPGYAVVTGVALAVVILGLNLLGDALSDFYDRRGRD
jgi:ABC-type methionine transport system permease subunit